MWVPQVSGSDPVRITKGSGHNWQPDSPAEDLRVGACLGWREKSVVVFSSSKPIPAHMPLHPRENGLFPVRPSVALLLVLLPAQSLDAKAL
jgi:hypothetical protein